MKTPYQTYYSESYNDSTTTVINEQWTQTIKSKLGISYLAKRRVLDVACGVSTLGKILSNNVYGLDLNEQAVRVAKKNGINAKIGDVEKKWDFPDDYFDIVIASHIIEHVVDTDKFILEAKRVLKKNGILIVATPNLAAWFNRILLLLGYQPFFSEVSTRDKTLGIKFTRKLTPLRSPLGHLRIFTANSLQDILELHNFKIIKTFGAEFLSFPPLLLYLDKIFSNYTRLSSNVIVVAKKNNNK